MAQTSRRCPSYQTPIEPHRAGPVCVNCGTPYPVDSGARPQHFLSWIPTREPALLWLAQFVTAGLGMSYLIPIGRAAFDLDSFSIGGNALYGREVLAHPLAYFAALTGALLLLTAIGLWREWPWTRRLLMSYWLLAGVSLVVLAPQPAPRSQLLVNAILLLGGALATCLYLYRKRSVVAYYAGLRGTNLIAPAA